jgi:tRNA threonylcarbamoyladenosine biosynthesis protein TsaB
MDRKMNILAIETSWERGSVALLEDRELRTVLELEHPKEHGRDLAPTVMAVLKETSVPVDELDLIAVDIGPGSYTGLRVGISFVKTLAFAEDVSVVGVTSCDAIASAAPVDSENLCVVIDAQWQEVYVARYRNKEGEWRRDKQIDTSSPEHVVETLDEQTTVIGNGIPSFRSQFESSNARIGPESSWYPEAETIAQLGYDKYEGGETADLVSLQPLYLRPTQADVDRN